MSILTKFLQLPDSYAVNLSLILICIPTVFGYLAIQKGQDNNWDTRNYHYYNAFAILEDRLEQDLIPAQIQSFLNPTIDLLNYTLNTKFPPYWAAFSLGSIQGINASLIFVLSLLLFRNLSALWRMGLAAIATFAGTYAPVMMGLIGTSTNDITTSIFVILPIILILPIFQILGGEHSQRRILFSTVSAGLILGMGIGLKLTLVVYGLGFIIAIVLSSPVRKESYYRVFIIGAAMAVGVLISRGWWMWYLWQTYDSPLFPFYNALFNSPFYPDVNFADIRYLPKNFMDHILFPVYRIYKNGYTYLQHYHHDIRYLVIYILSLVWLMKFIFVNRASVAKDNVEDVDSGERAHRFLFLFFIISYIIWQLKFSIYRFTNPLELISPAVIFILLNKILKDPFHILVGFIGSVLLIVTIVNVPQWERLPFKSKFIQVQAPVLSHPENTMIIIAGGRPWSYLIPAFPPMVRFVRIGGNFFKDDRPTKFLERLKDTVEAHEGDIFLLSRQRFLRKDMNRLANFGLRLAERHAMPINSAHEAPGLFLVRVQKGQ